MESINRSQIVSILESGDFGELVGLLETEFLDFKDQPYQLDSLSQRFAFLEDIISFANHEGGTVVLGCRTTRADVEGDIVTEIRCIPQALLNFELYRELCNQNIYPLIKGVTFNFFSSREDQSTGIALISIPKAAKGDWPHLIAHVLTEADRKITTKYGLTRRTGARNAAYSVHSLHALIQAGSMVSEVQARLDSIERHLASPVKTKPQSRDGEITLQENSSNLRRYLPKFMEETGLKDKPILILAMAPSQNLSVEQIYDRESPVSKAFDEMPEIRQSGFGFTISADNLTIAGGSARRLEYTGYKVRQLDGRGLIVAAAPADEQFLGWAMNRAKGQPVRYRSYVLAEATYLFAALVRKVLDALPQMPSEIDLFVGLRNCFVDGQAPLLPVAHDHGQFFHSWVEPKPAPKSDLLKSERVSSSLRTERLAFEYRALLYRRFGFTDELIPYSTLEEDGRVTKAEYITNPTVR